VFLVAVLVVMFATNIATNTLAQRWYVPVSVVASAVLLTLGRAAGLSWNDLGLGTDHLGSGLLQGLGIAILVLLIFAPAFAWPVTRRAFSDRRWMGARGRTIAYRVAVAIPFGTVVAEETAFRGVLFGMISTGHGSRISGTGWAIGATALLFGIWHVLPALDLHTSHAGLNSALGASGHARLLTVLGTVGFTAVGGAVFATLRAGTGSLLPPMSLHWALNAMAVIGAWLVGRNPRSQGEGSHISPGEDEASAGRPLRD
jgi:uncharacterized protein